LKEKTLGILQKESCFSSSFRICLAKVFSLVPDNSSLRVHEEKEFEGKGEEAQREVCCGRQPLL